MADLAAPIISYLLFNVKESTVEPFERGLARLLEEGRATPGCCWAYAFKGEDLTPSYMVLSGWESEELMRAWEESPRHVRLSNLAEEEWFVQPVIMRRYQNLG